MIADTANLVGAVLGAGRYKVLGPLGEGGMALVFRAQDRNLQKDVVLKVPRPALLLEPEFAGRFAREIRSLVELQHPHIVPILDVGEHDGLPFAVMRFLAGGSLEDRLQGATKGSRKALPDSSLAAWLEPVAQALDFVHARRYVHRDVKPANILFDPHGNAFLSDFGIAKAVADVQGKEHKTTLTRAGMVLGTGPYMAPEVLLGEPYDGRADQYALAITVYEVLSGRLPFNAAEPARLVMQQMTGEYPLLHTLVPKLPQALCESVDKALSRQPKQRFADCTSFARAVLGTPPRTRSLPATPPPLARPTAPKVVEVEVVEDAPVRPTRRPAKPIEVAAETLRSPQAEAETRVGSGVRGGTTAAQSEAPATAAVERLTQALRPRGGWVAFGGAAFMLMILVVLAIALVVGGFVFWPRGDSKSGPKNPPAVKGQKGKLENAND
jgi:serine/threonine-protein kinase